MGFSAKFQTSTHADLEKKMQKPRTAVIPLNHAINKNIILGFSSVRIENSRELQGG